MDPYGRCRGLLNPIAPPGARGGAVGEGGQGGVAIHPEIAQVVAPIGPPPVLARANAAVGGGGGDRIQVLDLLERAIDVDLAQLDRGEARALLEFLLDDAPLGLAPDQREALIAMMLGLVQ
jgi:hypothetical protein